MTEPQPQDMSEANNVVDMNGPVVSRDMDSDVPTSDMDADQSEPVVPTFAIKLEAPSVSTQQQNIPLWVQVRNQEELLTYQNNQASISAGTPNELIYLIPNAQSMGFWVKWPSLTQQKTQLSATIGPTRAMNDDALWSDFKHVWHMRSSPTTIPSSKGGIELNATPLPPGLNFLGPAFRGHAEAINVEVGQEFTIMFWFRYNEQETGPVRILSLNEAPAVSEFKLELNQNYLKMYQSDLSHNHSTNQLQAKTFHHIVLTRDSSGVSIRVNGEDWGSNAGGQTAQTNSFHVQVGEIGKDLAFAELWMAEGSIDAARLDLLYRNQLQGIQNAQDPFVVTQIE